MAVTRTGSVTAIQSTANSGSDSITVPSDAELMVLALVGCMTASNPSTGATITIGGQSMTARVYGDASTDDYAHIWTRCSGESGGLPTGSQTLAWDLGGTGTWVDGGQLIYAFYKGVNTSTPIRDTAEEYVVSYSATTGTMTAQSGDAVFAASYLDWGGSTEYADWTNATELYDANYNGTAASAAEAFPSGNVTITVNNSGSQGSYTSIGAIVIAMADSSTVDQEGFRFRNDDGDEDAATWKADQDTNITAEALNQNIRIRLLLNATNDPASGNYELQYRRKPSGGSWGAWGKVTA